MRRFAFILYFLHPFRARSPSPGRVGGIASEVVAWVRGTTACAVPRTTTIGSSFVVGLTFGSRKVPRLMSSARPDGPSARAPGSVHETLLSAALRSRRLPPYHERAAGGVWLQRARGRVKGANLVRRERATPDGDLVIEPVNNEF